MVVLSVLFSCLNMLHRFNVLFLAVFLCLFNIWALAAPLISATELSEKKQDQANLRIVDIRPADDYRAGHIPGAVSAPYSVWRGPADNPGQLLALSDLTQLIRSLGIDEDTYVVVTSSGTDATDFGAAARVYWTLKYLGLDNLSILNGGMRTWEQAVLDLDKETPVVTPSNFRARPNNDILATRDEIAARLDDETAVLVDARPQNFYLGDAKAPVAKKPGTIKNAINFSHDQWFEPGSGLFISADKAHTVAKDLLAQPGETTISFCNTGHWAATDWFALSEVVGLPNVKLYPESMTEWSQSALPMDNVPSRGRQIINQLKNLLGRS